MTSSLWQTCQEALKHELPASQFSTWIRPLQADFDGERLVLFAPNRFVLDWVCDNYLVRINELLAQACGNDAPKLHLDIGNISPAAASTTEHVSAPPIPAHTGNPWERSSRPKPEIHHKSNINLNYVFDNFVEGK